MSQYLFKVQQLNRLKQKGLLKRFSVDCYGHQETLQEIREKKNKLFMHLKNKKHTKEYEIHFMRYRPFDNDSSSIYSTVSSKPITSTPITSRIYSKPISSRISSKPITSRISSKQMITKKRKRGRGGLFI